MNVEQLRAEFEAWWKNRQVAVSIKEDAFAAYQAGRAALQFPPNTGELPHQSREAVLRAMSRNYTPGKHTWDSLDADACAKGADEIRQLRAALALQSQDAERIINAARVAMDESFDHDDGYQDLISIPAEKAAALSLALDEYDARRIEGEDND